MMTERKVTGFSETHDLFAVLILFLPDKFPSSQKKRDPEYWFGLLFSGIDSIVSKLSKKPAALEVMIRVKIFCEEAKFLYGNGEIDAGRFRLQDADSLLQEARKLASVRA